MKSRLLSVVAALAACCAALALAGPAQFRAPQVAPQVVTLGAPTEKSAHPARPGLTRLGDVRPLAKAASLTRWTAVDGGFVARLAATSATAQGLRVRLDLGTMPGAMEIRAQGSDPTRLETMTLDPTLGTEAWTPYTEGDTQLIEVFSPVAPSEDALRVGAMLHLEASPFAKAAASCTISTQCTSGDSTLDAQITERKKSVMRILFNSGGSGYACTATLIDTPRNPTAYALTANHCIGTTAEAGSVTAFWFYESNTCDGGGVSPGSVQTAGGAQLIFTNPNVDSTLMLMNPSPPPGVTYSPLNTARVPDNTPIISISHPMADTSRWADGTMLGLARPFGTELDTPYDMYAVQVGRGYLQGGSSGSGMFTRTNNRLELAGIFSLGPEKENCTDPEARGGLFDRLEVFYPEMAQFIGAASVSPDDAPNRVADATTAILGNAIDLAPSQPAITVARRIDYAGDVDIFRFTVSSPVALSAYTTGTSDTVIALQDSDGNWIESNDDAQTIDNNAGVTHVLQPGTYFANVSHWQPNGTGAYNLVLQSDRVDTNYTALWWNANESGWGINLDHQGNIIFATLFTYDDTGGPMWLVLPRADRQNDGSYSGALYRTTGPAFNTVPWTSINSTQVGTMRFVFSGENAATLTYSFNGRSVTKQITRQQFKTLPTCAWSIFDRSFETNVQDLWWNPNESGWGINFAHQENVVFATLFTYDSTGKGLWLVMPDGEPDDAGVFRGALYSTRGPAFDAQPWTAISNTQVGNMSVDFTNGNSATLTYTVDGITVNKTITRQVFSSPKTKCTQ